MDAPIAENADDLSTPLDVAVDAPDPSEEISERGRQIGLSLGSISGHSDCHGKRGNYLSGFHDAVQHIWFTVLRRHIRRTARLAGTWSGL